MIGSKTAYNAHTLMPLFWLRVALTLYGIGLLGAVMSLWVNRSKLTSIMLGAAGSGMVFHFVSLTEIVMLSDTAALSSLHQIESFLAFLLMTFFLVVYGVYKTVSPGIAVFPLVFLLTLSAQTSAISNDATASQVSNSWVNMHVGLILIGYSALIFSFFASILYLIQEKNLKAKGKKRSGFWSRLPALATIDEIGYRCLVFGFPFMTFGLISGSVLAEARFGTGFFRDPTILSAIVMWVLYTILLYARWSAGWRGKRAAYMAACAFGTALVVLAANGLSSVHRFVSP
ncbi:MAG TPA: cytochrome c biogenesis protein CcsA [Candidatus Angelobacter sp.]|nr:cytochrome c biogenesis protein CcsA [Candidatus Angelobacter sp.]